MDSIMTLRQIADHIGATLENCIDETVVCDVVTDSRKVTPGSVFVALRGEKFDGHNFVNQVTSQGAVCSVVDKNFENSENAPVMVVDDTRAALLSIARYYRGLFNIPSIAITGSVGKTSTKDMVSQVLAEHYNVLKTEGNFNNEIGLPLTVFRMSDEHQLAVFEMGMSAFGEISRLTAVAMPETAILTNIGYSHIEHLGSRENILKAKLEILEGLSPDGTVVLCGDDEYLWNAKEQIPFETMTYGIENTDCDLIAENVEKSENGTRFQVTVDGETYTVEIGVPGVHHVYNALAAIITGYLYSVPVEEIISGIEKFKPSGMRQDICELSNKIIIRDCYNASPTSMKSGLEVLTVTKPKDADAECRRVAVLGDMLELGDFAKDAHFDVGTLCSEYGVDCLVAIGPNAKYVAEGAIAGGFSSPELYVFYDNTSAIEHISEIVRPNDVILFKGSRGMRLEEVADYIAENDMN